MFLEQVITDLLQQEQTNPYTIILPNKRASLFFKSEWIKQSKTDGFLPKMLAVEDFYSNLSGYRLMNQQNLWFEMYRTYQNLTKKPDSFDVFVKWIPTIIKDFNDLDANLVDTKSFFHHIISVERLENWEPIDINENQSLLQKNKTFWELMEKLYYQFSSFQDQHKTAYSGYIYRKAYENRHISQAKNGSTYVFIGFNALNAAEIEIIQHYLNEHQALIYFDADTYYLDNEIQEAGTFLRKIKKWNYFDKKPFSFIQNKLILPKKIEVIALSKQIGQVKYAATIINQWQEQGLNLSESAWVLADENLLIPALSSLPPTLDTINVTMGYPIKDHLCNILILDQFKVYNTIVKTKKNRYYTKEVIQALKHPYYTYLLTNKQVIIDKLIKKNILFISPEQIDNKDFNTFFLTPQSITPNAFVQNILSLFTQLKTHPSIENNPLEKEYLYKFITIFNTLADLLNTYDFELDLPTLQVFYKQLLNQESLNFYGEPLKGLQLMGVLETRVLDFKNIIITSVNEGILPKGKSDNSFIPFDVRKNFNLPTFQEQDAIFAYHFYRLLQCAENITLLYNAESDEMGSGEKSRFISQLELELPNTIIHKTVSENPQIQPREVIQLYKTPTTLEAIDNLFKKGISPSSLSLYIRNPLQFYKEKILKIREEDSLHEEIDARILGQIIHETLEELYKPLLKKEMIVTDIEKCLKIYPSIMKSKMHLFFSESEINSGKNIIIYKIADELLKKFLYKELNDLKNGNKIIIKSLEEELKYECIENNKSIQFIGRADRIDCYNGITRIIDYKTGKIEQSHLSFSNFNLLVEDEKYDKPFQLLLYALMYLEKNPKASIQAGIVSFKNLDAGTMLATQKISTDKKNPPLNQFTTSDLQPFKETLFKLLEDIRNSSNPFEEKIEKKTYSS